MFSLVEDINKIIPNEYDPQIFAGFLDQAEEYSEDSEFVTDNGSAREFAEVIDGLIGKYHEQLRNDKETEKRLRALSVKMHWMNVGSLESNVRKDLVSSNLVSGLKMGMDVLSIIEKWLDLFEWGVGPDNQRRSDFSYLLANNEEFIGANNIKLSSGESAVPTVRNWIKDYLSSLPENKKLIGSFDKIHFLTNNQNAVTLNENDKNILSKIIDIYNFIKNPNENLFQAPNPPRTKSSFIPKSLAKFSSPAPIISKPNPNFDQKLTQVSAPMPHGRDLEVLREQLERGQGSGEREKGTSVIKMTPEEIKREVAEIELPGHQEPKEIDAPKLNPSPPAPLPKGEGSMPRPQPSAPSPFKSASSLQSLAQISMVDDLKKIEIAHLRQGPLAQQLQTIRSKIFSIAQANRLYPYYTVNAFEQSPLFRAYLQTGSSKITENKTEGGLSQAEFEAIADFKKEIERL